MSPFRALRVVSTTLALPAAIACADAPYEPAALLLTPELEAAIDIATELPTLPRLVDLALARSAVPQQHAAALLRARSLWSSAATAADVRRAEILQARAYAAAADPLALLLSPGEVAVTLDALEEWLATARAIPGAASIPELSRALTRGRELLDETAALLADGRAAQAMASMLAAADVLAATTPRGVAGRLITVAEARLADAREADVSESDRRRADRLLRGARAAFDSGDYPLAIRRAYYAGQLLRAS